jgi:hypothetical protein
MAGFEGSIKPRANRVGCSKQPVTGVLRLKGFDSSVAVCRFFRYSDGRSSFIVTDCCSTGRLYPVTGGWISHLLGLIE